ncbi:hypothetical protein F4801DRAFT_578029 [Xylaria longipes]|nr:hypothetical protein F4801DRAFT_578029 [Xylaria longipes]
MPAPQEPQQQAPMEMSSTSTTGVVTQQPAAEPQPDMSLRGDPAPDDPYAERRRYPYGTFLESKTSGGWYQYPEPLPPPVPPAQRLDISDYTLPLEERFLGFDTSTP